MRFDVVTLFPEMFAPFAEVGVVGRAVSEGHVGLRLVDLRSFGLGKHRSVDDTPYGGGAGMVMRVDCIVACLEALEASAPSGPDGPILGRRILLSPQGERFTQRVARRLVESPAITLVCGRYEGFDERVRDHMHEELSLGDFVLSGGEIAAMGVVDACARLVPGVLGNPASLAEESHAPGRGLEYPQYTRPAVFRGAAVPEILLSGHHGRIAAWRDEQARARTAARRPDLAGERE
jgi:tRNA (guanine37-N1)-methyltransferase